MKKYLLSLLFATGFAFGQVPVNLTLPAITGDLKDGGTVRADYGTWKDANFWRLQTQVNGVTVYSTKEPVSFKAKAGDTYRIRVEAKNDQIQGPVVWSVDYVVPPLYSPETPYAAPAKMAALSAIHEGINLTGGENKGDVLPGTYGKDYIFPSTAAIDYYASRGFTELRIPFRLARAQPVAFKPLDPAHADRLAAILDYAAGKGLRVILDPHDYGNIRGARFVSDPAVKAEFVDFWGRMASKYRNYPNAVFGLMNEPGGTTAKEWQIASHEAIQAIRLAGALQLILIPGAYGTGAYAWVKKDNGAAWAGYKGDPLNNFAFEMHQYLDTGNSGTHDTCMSNSAEGLIVPTKWLRDNGFKGYMGEYGFATNAYCLTTSAPLYLDYMKANSDVWIGRAYWAGGEWLKQDYMYGLNPASYTAPVDHKQLPLLQSYMRK